MIYLNLENYRRNAELLLQGIWYSNPRYAGCGRADWFSRQTI